MAHPHTLGQSAFRAPPPTPSQEAPRRRVRTGFGQAQALAPPPPEATAQELDPQERAGEIVQELLGDLDEMFRQMRGQINSAQRQGMDIQRIFGPGSGIQNQIERNVGTLRDAFIAAKMDPSKADRVRDLFLSLVPLPQNTLQKVGEAETLQAVTRRAGGELTARTIAEGPPKRFRPEKPTPFVANQNRRNLLVDVKASLLKQGRTEAAKVLDRSIKELDAKLRKESTPTEPTSAFFEIRNGKRFLKPSVSDSVRKSTAVLHGGIFDLRTGKMSFTNPEDAPLAVATAAFADKLILTGEETTVANAVQAAGRAFGVSFPSLPHQGVFVPSHETSLGNVLPEAMLTLMVLVNCPEVRYILSLPNPIQGVFTPSKLMP